jgi:HPt (histidine-containing phosphotransfer) domain-containing protein
MLSVEALKASKVDTEKGLSLCMNNEDFYLRMVAMALADQRFAQLRGTIDAGDLNAGFQLAHALKGVVGNLYLTPLYEPISEMTELLRSRTQADYGPLLDRIEAQYAALTALL